MNLNHIHYTCSIKYIIESYFWTASERLTIVSAVHLKVLISFFLWEKLLSLIDIQDCRTTEALDGLLIYLPEKLMK